MKLRCRLIKLSAAIGCRKTADRHAASCPCCREELETAEKLDAFLRQPVSPAPTGRAPVDVIAAVRSAAATPEPAPSRMPATAIWACATLVAGLLIAVVVSSNDKPAPSIVEVQPQPVVEPVQLPTATIAETAKPAELSLAGFESEFALLAADFRRSTGRE